jgi:hypothetical protein
VGEVGNHMCTQCSNDSSSTVAHSCGNEDVSYSQTDRHSHTHTHTRTHTHPSLDMRNAVVPALRVDQRLALRQDIIDSTVPLRHDCTQSLRI